MDTFHQTRDESSAEQTVGDALLHVMGRYATELEARIAERTAELELERKKLQIILDATGEGIFYSEQGMIQYANHRLSALTGYKQDELVGQPTTLLKAAALNDEYPTRLHDIRRATPQNGGVWYGEARLRRKDGSEFEAGITVSLIITPGGGWNGTVTLVRDISQEKSLQQQKDRFIAIASHKLRSPLTNLKLALHLARVEKDKEEEHIDRVRLIVNTMGELVEDLLDITRFERRTITLRKKLINLQLLVSEVVEMYRPLALEKEIRLECDVYHTPLWAEADASRLKQALTNLVMNAINYTPRDRYIMVSLCPQPSIEPSSNHALIRVFDTGIGIPPEMLSKVFDPFVRVNEGASRGTGLGLTISKEVVDLHGGELKVESEVGVGSVFTMKLSLSNQP